MDKLNILESDKVVMYNGISSAKAWFIMKYYGHPNTRILRGGLKQWTSLDYPITSMRTPIDYTNMSTNTFEAKEPNTKMLIEYGELLTQIDSNFQLKLTIKELGVGNTLAPVYNSSALWIRPNQNLKFKFLSRFSQKIFIFSNL
jgi:hypothetical protein